MQYKVICAVLLMQAAVFAQADRGGALDSVTTQVRHVGDVGGAVMTFGDFVYEVSQHGYMAHPYHISAKHPNGDEFYIYDGFNMRTSAGTTWQSSIMGNTSTPAVNTQCNFLGVTNTAVVPAEADTTLSGEFVNNGFNSAGISGAGVRAQATYTDGSGALTVPSAPTVTVVGTAASTGLWYWVQACNQGVCSTLSSAGTTTTSQPTASLSNVLYNQISWPSIGGAATYQVLRTTSSTPPSGTVTNLVGNTAYCAGATCTQNDTGVALASVTIPASNLTNFGKYTLVHTWTATASQAAQAFGVFTASAVGTMCFEGTFTPVSLNNGDTFQLTETVLF